MHTAPQRWQARAAYQHSENGFLQRIAQVSDGALAGVQLGSRLCLDVGKDARERHVHALHHVRQLDKLLAPEATRKGGGCETAAPQQALWLARSLLLLCCLLDVVARGWVVRQADTSSKTVQAVAHGNVDGLAKDAVAVTPGLAALVHHGHNRSRATIGAAYQFME